ncbi:MAG TPA: CGNR zinc finger domain-containing protein [Tepidiformaceae bacterium]|nr:CGNR zinc finger domain-containing protein [Tepidiformaceae bacterium]
MSTDLSQRAPAPGALGVVQQFLNSVDIASGTDVLRTPADVSAWFAERRLFSRPGEQQADALPEVGDADFGRVLQLRTALRDIAEGNLTGRAAPSAVETVNRIAALVPMAVRFDTDNTTLLTPLGEGAELAIGWILAITFDAMNTGTWQRLRLCAATDCRFAFYDASRNRTGTWCSMSTCGNRAKVRAYQQRQRGRALPA